MILALGVAVIVRARVSSASTLFTTIALLGALWLTGFALMYESPDAAHALFWARFGSLFALLIPAAVFHFSAIYAGRGIALRPAVIVAWLFSAAIAMTASVSSIFTSRVEKFSWGYYPIGYAYNIAWVAAFAVLLALALRLLSRAAQSEDGESRARFVALVRAFAIGSFAFIDFLPTFGLHVYPLGFLAILAFTGVAADAIWRYPLVELTPEYAAGQILATMKGAVLVADLQSKIRVVNRAAVKMLGYETAEDLLGRHVKTIIDPGDSVAFERLMQSSGMVDLQMAWRAQDGSRIDVLVATSFVRAADGMPVGIVYAATDITERRRAEQALRESEHRYRTLFEGNPLPMAVYDIETYRFLAVNDAAVQNYGYSKDEFLRLTLADIRTPEDASKVQAALAAKRDAQLLRYASRHRKKDGTFLDVEISSYEFVSAGRRARLAIAADVTERRRADQKLRESEERYRLLFERNLAGVFRTTVDGRVLDVNDALARMFGFEREELLRSSADVLYFSEEERKRLISRLRQQKTLSNVEVRMRRRDGAAVWALENMTVLDGPDGGVIEGTIIDITDRKEAQEQIEYQAYHDILTGLPNRLLFRDRIEMALAHARRTKRVVAVMFLDLDQFKLVNDTLGHTVGDGLLHAAGDRLVRCVRAEDTVARMGGDEFTILLYDIADNHAAATVAKKVLEAMAMPMVVDHHELFITTSIGIALFPGDGDDAESLLKSADRAMYRAKESGRNTFQFSTQAGRDIGAERLSLERSMHYASRRDEFVVHYQPVVDITSDRVVGAEALIRWNHPVRGIMGPGEFIPIAEQSGLIVAMGEWVLRSACDQMRRWRGAGNDHLRIAVNLSARQFQQPDLADVIERVLGDTGLVAAALEIEITESTAMQNADLTLSTLNKLKEMGVRISIDDFGTGYSSLSYLKRFPIDTVKIDHDFVRDVAHDPNDAAIVSAIISMARALKLQVIAEGVENEEQLAFLRKHGCDLVQGYLYSQPVGAADFEREMLNVEC